FKNLEHTPPESDTEPEHIEMSEPEHFFHSSLIPTKQSVSWMLHNISDLNNMNAWTAYSCTLEVPIGTHRLSKFNVSLAEKNGIVYIRPRLLSPQNETVTYQLSVRLGGAMIAFKVGEIANKMKDKDVPNFQLDTFQSLFEKTVDDNLELGLMISVFSQDHWETRE
ncbi:unnamed protein product, partial [Allacma fusca]